MKSKVVEHDSAGMSLLVTSSLSISLTRHFCLQETEWVEQISNYNSSFLMGSSITSPIAHIYFDGGK